MSKEKPRKKQTTKKTRPDGSDGSVIYKNIPNVELIRLDLKGYIYILACLFFFLLFVSLKLHNSSIPYWNQLVLDGGDPERGLVAGTPRGIRSDEWMVSSSFILAQAAKGFPVSNEAVGYGKTPLTFGLPTNHWLSKLKPVFWGFYFFGIERGFSWYWSFKIFPFLIASFLLLMLFTKNNFWISVFGSVWLFLSSAVQWWSINTEIFTWGCLCVISFIYILSSQKTTTLALHGVLLTLSAYSLAMILYPPFQVPLAYFLLALVIGYLIKNKNELIRSVKESYPKKLIVLGSCFGILALLIYLFFNEAKETIQVVSNTVYPGKRIVHGGNFKFLKMFTDNYSLFMNDAKFPVKWQNICELSAFLMLSPMASIVVVADYFKTKKINTILLSILLFQLIAFTWLFAGFPGLLAKLSFFSMSQTERTFLIVGFSNVIFTLLFINDHKSSIFKNNIISQALAFVVILLISFAINYSINKQADSFFSPMQVWIASILFAILNWLVIYSNLKKAFQIAFFILCLAFLIPNLSINPLSQGLAPYYENRVFNMVTSIEAKDPGARWLVFGKYTIPDYLKGTGINCISGVQFAPPFEKLKLLDPQMKYDSVYNRYAHVAFTSFIDGRDSIEFVLLAPDVYTINMDPCSPRLYQMGIKYFMFTYQPQPVEVEYMTPIANDSGYYIYKRNEE